MATAARNALDAAQASLIAKTPVVELRELTRGYGAGIALHQLNLSLYAGEIVALLGPNGAGKSTTVRLLLGLISPDAGTVRIFGCDPRLRSSRTRIGAMLQGGSVPEVLKVREHVDLFRKYYAAPMALARLVAIAHLEGIMDKRFGELSGGEKQRTLFALALAGDPDIVILDEPTAGMDIEMRRSLWAEIRNLSARGKTILLTTHYLEEADALATRVIILDRGRILREGTTAEIKHAGESRQLRLRTRLSLAVLREMPGVLAASYSADTRLTLLETNQVDKLLCTLVLQDETLSDFEVITPALEDAFLALVSPATANRT